MRPHANKTTMQSPFGFARGRFAHCFVFGRALGLSALMSLGGLFGDIATANADVPSDVAAQAEALFQEARTLMANGQYAEACQKLRASQDLDPGYGTLFNLAECLSKEGKTASAWAAFHEAAGMAEKSDQQDRVEKANRYAAELEPQLFRMNITVTTEVPGLVVTRDGVPVARAIWGAALPVDPGKHKVEATAPGKMPWKAEVETVGAGGTLTVAVPMLLDVGTRDSGVSSKQEPAGSGRRTIAIVTGGLGVASFATGSLLFGLASSKWSNAQENHCRTPTLCDAEGVALAGDAKTFADAATGLLVGGAVLAGVGVVLFATAPRGGKPQSTLLVRPLMGQTNGVVLAGDF